MIIKNPAGAWGEVYAARYLRDHGFRILTANYACRFGELDLVAAKGNAIRFVEVKTRSADTTMRPMEAVDVQKQTRLRLTAAHFLRTCKAQGVMQFDVCEVYLTDEMALARINYMENAFG